MFPSDEKRKIRKEKLSLLSTLPNREEKTEKVVCAALSYVQKTNAKKVAVYLSVRDELSTEKLILSLWENGIRVFAPVVCGEEMKFVEYSSDTPLLLGAFGIPEPLSDREETSFDVMFVPLVAFDDDNNRLGHGKGYYDRYFKKHPLSGKKIGLAFAEQKTACVPIETADVPLDGVISF